MKPSPNEAVRSWFDEQAAETLYLSSVTIAELMFGIGALPDGKRKDRLIAALDGVITLFNDRILPFDLAAARRYADLAVKARKAGNGFPTPDGYIASIAASQGFAVATRDSSAFDAACLEMIDPWTASKILGCNSGRIASPIPDAAEYVALFRTLSHSIIIDILST